MQELNIKSPSKINIGLNIISKRDDGYHNLETIFYPLSLSDEILIIKSEKFHFTSDDKSLQSDDNNLVTRAHRLTENFTNEKLNCKIILRKHIPIGAGLGGGSSNAAAILKGLNELFELRISKEKLKELALQLGSDVPLFLEQLPAFAESRGEIIRPVKINFSGYVLIVNPGIHISTKWAFTKIAPKTPDKSLKVLIKKNTIDFNDLIRYASNDFENVVFKEFPQIKEIKERFLQFGSCLSLMTGTGSTVFGFFEDEESVYQAELFFKCKNYFTYLEKVS